MIEIVKSSRLLKKIGDTTVTTKVILEALKQMNRESTARLGTLEGVEHLRSCDMRETR